MARKQKTDGYESALQERRAVLQEQLDKAREGASRQMGDIGFWGGVGAIGFMVDWVFLGGVGMVIAGASVFFWANDRIDVGQARKELKEVEENLQKYQELKLKSQPLLPAKVPASVTETFDEVASLKKKLAELEKQVDDLQNPKVTKLDKPATYNPKSR